MRFTLNDDQAAFKAQFARFVDERIAPRAAEVDRAGLFPHDNHKALAEIGYHGISHEEGVDPIIQLIAQEELARGCASTFLSVGASVGLFGIPLRRFARPEVRDTILPALLRGELIGAWALTEPHCGTDAAAMRTTARRTPGGWTLNGSKMFITNGPVADWVIVAARTDVEAGHAGVSLFLVKKGTKGYSAGSPLAKLGCRGSPTSALSFDDCEIPEEWLIGEEGMGFVYAMQTLESGRLGMAAFGVGIAQAALDDALRYASQREAFGKRIVQFQPIHFKIADMRIEIDGARLLMYRAAWLAARGECPQALYSAAKLYATEAAVRCTDRSLQIHGGYGYMEEYRVERLYRDARLGPVGEGTSEIQRRLIAQETLSSWSSP